MSQYSSWNRSALVARALDALLTIFTLAMLTGCIFSRGTMGQEFEEERVAALESIEKGVTTRGEVVEKLGAPHEIVSAARREIYHYRRFEGKLGLILFFSRANVRSDHLYVLFNGDGVVEDVLFSKGTDDLEFQVWPFGD